MQQCKQGNQQQWHEQARLYFILTHQHQGASWGAWSVQQMEVEMEMEVELEVEEWTALEQLWRLLHLTGQFRFRFHYIRTVLQTHTCTHLTHASYRMTVIHYANEFALLSLHWVELYMNNRDFVATELVRFCSCFSIWYLIDFSFRAMRLETGSSSVAESSPQKRDC